MSVAPRDRNFVRVGNAKARLYRIGDGRWQLDLRPHGRKLRAFRDRATAEAEAYRELTEINAGGVEVLALTSQDRAVYAKAVSEASCLGTDLLAAISEWAAARRALAGRFSIQEALKAGLAALERPVYRTADVAAELLASKAASDFDGRTARDLRNILREFATAFPGDIAAITPEQIETWLAARIKSNGKALSAKRSNHIHAIIVSLFKFARSRGRLPDIATAAQRIEKRKLTRGAIDYFTPPEMMVILRHIEDEWVPWPVLVGFCALRVEEIALGNHAAERKDCLRWEDFDWIEREIVVREAVAKTGRPRRIPVPENACAWLEPWRKAHGPVLPSGDVRGRLENYRERFKAKLTKLSAETDELTPRLLRWPQNALRHSYGSYRMAVTKNAQQVSNEMGDSPAMIHRHYDNPRPLSQAKAWWSIFPVDAARASQLILRFEVPA